MCRYSAARRAAAATARCAAGGASSATAPRRRRCCRSPARNAWSTSSGLRRARRPRMRLRNSRRVKRHPAAPARRRRTGRRRRRTGPIRPNLRMSRKRSSRPSSSSSARRSYGSCGSAAGTTNSCPVILRWTVRKAPPSRSIRSCLPRRPTASIRRPVTPATNRAGSSSRNVRGPGDARPVMTGPAASPGSRWRRRSRATVSTSGSSGIGAARHDRDRLGRLVGLGEDRVAARDRAIPSHESPTFTSTVSATDSGSAPSIVERITGISRSTSSRGASTSSSSCTDSSSRDPERPRAAPRRAGSSRSSRCRRPCPGSAC